MKKLDDGERVCALCSRATEITGHGQMLCSKRGVVAKEHVCRSFRYDPLKRIPRRRILETEELPTLD